MPADIDWTALAMPPRRIPILVQLERCLGRLEGGLSKQLPGKTLLGEIVLPAGRCSELAGYLAATTSRVGAIQGRTAAFGWASGCRSCRADEPKLRTWRPVERCGDERTP